ncbi:YktB family protein [Sporosarcina sp. FSL K6-3457]|uniref:YktB family protein n=1 Tax=Sporosarcina sp. FSL K6-3457 TaxID=2978204 RepID=UPI0030FB1DB2
MDKYFWAKDDFDVFSIEGLENRMEALQNKIQPKFAILGRHFADRLSAHGTDEFFPHVAKHARRTVNPPRDSWVAFAPAKRGYKALPHFQIGLWGTHLFIIVAVIYENPDKKGIAERLSEQLDSLTTLPASYIVSGDHMKPDAVSIDATGSEGVIALLDRLQTVKKAEFLVGRHLSREEAASMSTDEFMAFAEETFDCLLPVYDIIIGRK